MSRWRGIVGDTIVGGDVGIAAVATITVTVATIITTTVGVVTTTNRAADCYGISDDSVSGA